LEPPRRDKIKCSGHGRGRLPKMNIGYRTYKMVLSDLSEVKWLGRANLCKGVMEIAEDVIGDSELTLSTLLHEMLESANFEYGFLPIESPQKEEFFNRLAYAMRDMMEKNKFLHPIRDYLFKVIKELS